MAVTSEIHEEPRGRLLLWLAQVQYGTVFDVTKRTLYRLATLGEKFISVLNMLNKATGVEIYFTYLNEGLSLCLLSNLDANCVHF